MTVPGPPFYEQAAFGALVGSLVTVTIGPLILFRYARYRSTKAYRAHLADVIRDFSESIAVMQVLLDNRRTPAMPVSGHLTKIAIPEELLTTKVVQVGDLSNEDRAQALWLVNILVNINRDIESIIRLLDRNKNDAFFQAVSELQDKMRNLSNKIKKESPFFKNTATSTRPKTIFFDDGSKVTGT